jgi:hypothetical protein
LKVTYSYCGSATAERVKGTQVKTARKLIVVLLFGALGMTASAEQRRGEVMLVRPPVNPIKFAGPWRPAGTNVTTKILGSVIDIRQIPVTHVRVQLRDLKTGKIIAQAESNANGEYEFELLEPGTFVVEMVMSDNRVIALSNAGSLGSYQTLNTVIQLPGRWDVTSRSMSVPLAATSFIGISSKNSMTSATITLAADLDIRPVDAGNPVSPQ